MARVFVAMSGGVDSSVAAALLLEHGHEVTGITMQLWESSDAENGCCSVTAVRDARRVCDQLGIAHYTLNYRELFERDVVSPFAADYAQGRTPNPCIACNDRLKFSDLLARVMAQGADFLATGHYARIVEVDSNRRLARGVDPDKDQSYFLYRLSDAQAAHVLFPVGELHKREVRDFARRFGLKVAEKAESQEACFATDGDYLPVVGARRPASLEAGEIVDAEGRALGHHEGVAHFTVGQRKGLGIGGLSEPLFVLRIDAEARRVVVGPRGALAVNDVRAEDIVWHGGHEERVDAVVRYRMAPVPAIVDTSEGGLRAVFDTPLLGVAPGQALVCYRGDVVIGGGVISCAS